MWILDLLLYSAVCGAGLTSALDVVYMEQWCGRSYDISQHPNIRIGLRRDYSDRPKTDCTFNVEGDYEHEDQLMIHVEALYLDETGCTAENLTIFDGPNKAYPRIGNTTFCGYGYPGTVYTSNSSSLTFHFKSDRDIELRGWWIVLTHYKKGSCSTYEVTCDSGRCIDTSLSCASYKGCGDLTNKTGCPEATTESHYEGPIFVEYSDTYTGVIIAVGVGVPAVIIIIVIVAVIARLRRRHDMSRRAAQPVTMATIQGMTAPPPPPPGNIQSEIPPAAGMYADQNMTTYPQPPPYPTK